MVALESPPGAIMKTNRALLGMAILFAGATAASAEVYKCQSREGTTYQQMPCPSEAIANTVAIPASYPDYMAERDRLAAREAAMDARLLRRLEIESAERIARDERVAREQEAQAERDRLAQMQSQGGPFYLVPFGTRVPPRHQMRSAWPVSVR
jgi:hypothetical protein